MLEPAPAQTCVMEPALAQTGNLQDLHCWWTQCAQATRLVLQGGSRWEAELLKVKMDNKQPVGAVLLDSDWKMLLAQALQLPHLLLFRV